MKDILVRQKSARIAHSSLRTALILCIFSLGAPAGLIPVPDTAGTRMLRAGRYADALDEVLSDSAFRDASFRTFKLGCAHQGLESWSKALFYFKKTAQDDALWAPFAYEKIGDIELRNNRYENALKAYRAAVDGSLKQRYAHCLYEKMYRIVTQHVEEIGDISWLNEIVGPPPTGVEIDLNDQLERLIGQEAWTGVDSLVESLLDTAEYHETHCAVAARLVREPVPDSIFSTKSLFRLSKVASMCGNYKAASDWLLEALSRSDFATSVDQQYYLFYRGNLNFRLGNHAKAVRWLKKYEKKYGLSPDLVYLVARSYRAMGKAALAAEWYDLHIQKYPKHAKTHDILWYLAWEYEEIGNYEKARECYKKIYQEHSRRSKADQSCFRYALSYIKDKQFENARAAFAVFMKKYPYSDLQTSARFWTAKTQVLLNHADSAMREFREIARTSPTDYYAFRCREMLLRAADSSQQLTIDTSCGIARAAFWLDSISGDSTEKLKRDDSIGLALGAAFVSLGMNEHADIFLEPVEICYPGNLLLQLELAALYKRIGDPTRSYDIARRFSWRIPQESRPMMPCAMYRLIYPFSFRHTIELYARRFKIEPELVYAIIRQESIFNPSIVSPVGAVGLMQIMPFTGEEIAKDLNETFAVDSLYNPEVNIRFGCYYISKLLDEFQGSFVLAIAGYNGGPHNAKKWHEANKDEEFDLFVEDIGFSETRGYVKKVLANYWIYQKLADNTTSVVDF